MNRRVFWSIIGVLALVTMSATWFFSHYDRVPTTTWERPGKAARRDPYLALDHFLARQGRPLARIERAPDLEHLPPGSALLLAGNRRLYVTPQRANGLLDWVRDGGYLIVEAEGESIDDPISEQLGVVWQELPEPAPQTPDAIPISFPGLEHPLQIARQDFDVSSVYLKATGLQPIWQAGIAPDANRLLHYAYGRGRITVVDDFEWLRNWDIGQHDHAELVWELLRHYQPEGRVELAARLEMPTLWHWLAESAWRVLISGGLLIAAWLWAIVPRFGGLLPVTEPERRGLTEHLSALGRAVWREGQLEHWANLVRRDWWEQQLHRHPHLALLSDAECRDFLARHSQIPPEQVAALLNPDAELSPDTYTALVRTAQAFDPHPHEDHRA